MRWVKNTLTSRKAIATMCKEQIEIDVKYGCPQGAGLSPDLWVCLVEELLDDYSLEEAPIYLYADDVTLLASGPDIDSLHRLVQERIKLIGSMGIKT